MSEQYGNTPRKIQECKNGFEREWSHYFWNEIILKNENKVNWYWDELSINPNITMEIVEAHPDKPWKWYGLSKHPNITWEIIETHPDKPWNWSDLSSNPNITMEIIETHPDKPWNWIGLSSNKFTKEKGLFMERKLLEHLAAFKIQTYWRRANYNPVYELCNRRLMKECDELGIVD